MTRKELIEKYVPMITDSYMSCTRQQAEYYIESNILHIASKDIKAMTALAANNRIVNGMFYDITGITLSWSNEDFRLYQLHQYFGRNK